MPTIKHAIVIFSTIIMISACTPSAPVIPTFTSTLTFTPHSISTITVTPSPTKNLEHEYLAQFIVFVNQWSDGYQKMKSVNQRVTTNGVQSVTTNKILEGDAILAMAYLQGSSEKMMKLTLPSPKFQHLQDKSKELNSSSVSVKNLFLLGIQGDQLSFNLSQTTLDEAFLIFTDIVNELKTLMPTK